MAPTRDIERIVRARDQMLHQLLRLEGEITGIERAIEIVGKIEDDPEWFEDKAGNPTRIVGAGKRVTP